MTFTQAKDIFCEVVTCGSLLYTFLPPWESFNDYPSFQRGYKFFMLCIVKFSSVNARSSVYPSIKATSNAGGTESK